MSFVKGQTTWSNIVQKLTGLACGEQSDDAGVVVSPEDRWLRMGEVSDNGLRSPVSRDIPTGPCYGRSGYFNATTNSQRFFGGQAPGYSGYETTEFVRCIAPFTSTSFQDQRTGHPTYNAQGSYTGYVVDNTDFKSFFCNVYCEVGNTVAGDYSTSKWHICLIDMEDGYTFYDAGNIGCTADGTVNGPNGLVLKIGNPDGAPANAPIKGRVPAGFVVAGHDSATGRGAKSFFRPFTSASNGGYLGGIDFWPNLWRASGAPVFATAPDGIQGTDWDLITHDHPNAQYPSNGGMVNAIRYGWGLGLGCKTAAALTGNRYEASWGMSKFMFRSYPDAGANNGLIFMQPGLVAHDKRTNQQRYGIHGFNGVYNWLKPFNVPGSVDPNAPIQYWMRVTAKCIVIVLNADPGFTGTTTQNWIVELDKYQSQTLEEFNVIFGQNRFDGNSEPTCYFWSQAYQNFIYQQHLKEGGRDYQIGWMRTDLGSGQSRFAGGTDNYYASSPFSGDNFTYRPNETGVTTGQPNGNSGPPGSGITNVQSYNFNGNYYYSPFPGQEAHPEPADGKWNLFSYGFHDGLANLNNESGVTQYRGYINCGVFYLPGYNWASGDELVDQAPGGDTYFLFSASHYGTGIRGSGGLAISET